MDTTHASSRMDCALLARAPRRPDTGRRERGFTLPEILLAATLGALLLIATARTAGMFGKEPGELKEHKDGSLEETLAAVSDAVRYAWWAEVPNSATLTISDPAGESTSYFFRQDKLIVVRPSGAQGDLLEGLKGGSFSAETTSRYREGSTSVRAGTFWSASAPAGVPQTQLLQAGDKLALGFTAASSASLGKSLIAGIQEQLVNATPTSIKLPIAAIAPVTGTVRIDLFRARAPDDGRPEGSSLASTTLDATSLPVATSSVWDTIAKQKINPPHGNAWGWWKKHANYVLIVDPPATSTAVDISRLKQVIQPGYAYTLQIQVTGSGGLAVAMTPTGTNNSGVAFESSAGGGMQAQALACARSLDGTLEQTRALATATVSRVHITLIAADGTRVSGSVALTGQGMADDAWLGVIPGESGP